MNYRNIRRIVSAGILLASFSLAQADPRVQVVWSCTLNDGKTLEDLQAANSAWIKWTRDNGGKAVEGYIANRISGGNLSDVLLIDSYPDWETYAEEAEKYDSPEGEAMDAAFQAAATCNSNAIWSVEESGTE